MELTDTQYRQIKVIWQRIGEQERRAGRKRPSTRTVHLLRKYHPGCGLATAYKEAWQR